RVAAASHLADCDRCRGVVVGLARVAGAGAEVKQQAVAATAAAGSERTPAWRALLASLFSPRAMRFAVPVLALSLVGVVSYVALRSNRGALDAARSARPQQGALENTTSAPPASNTGTADPNAGLTSSQNANAALHDASAPVVQPGETRGHGGADGPVMADAENKDAQPSVAAEPPSPVPPPPPASAAAEGPAELSKAAPAPKQAATEEGEDARSDSRESAERREKSARAPEPADDAALSNNDAVQRSRAAQTRMNETQVQMPDGGTRNQKRAADNSASGGYVGGSAAPPKESERDRAGTRSEGRAAARRPEKKKADDDEDAPARGGDTRTAAGHRFRREGSAWVDVNYKPSMPSTGVRRGTEAFRALVADVPEVGRVAEALGGEVIVVVGGRAYRIR
ncbi:MAG TPA: hypothetical protein VN282_15815, partial [Pyrinomonadaceae bacterium]|nr:hypothetical protein [Pyrinomonadaceae bacterium]